LVKILKFFDADPGSRIRDGKNLDPGSGILDGNNLDPESGIWDGKIRIRDPGSGINIPDQQNWKSRRQICWDLKNRVIIKPFVEKAFWDEKGRISGVKERKNTCKLDFSLSNKTRPPSPNYVPRG
jgi:hypothetical protein